MGGFGSGRQKRSAKNTTSKMHLLDVRHLHRKQLLSEGHAFNWQWKNNQVVIAHIHIKTEKQHILLDYQARLHDDAWHHMSYPIKLAWTNCHFGGNRPWFLCPACGRRVAILYGGSVFACRHCHNLTYECQQEVRYDRDARRADRIREKLKWLPGIFNGNGIKPKGMHWSTYERLVDMHNAYVSSSLYYMALHLKVIDKIDNPITVNSFEEIYNAI